MWTFFSIQSDQLLFEHLEKFNSGTIKQQEASRFFEYQRGEIERYISETVHGAIC